MFEKCLEVVGTTWKRFLELPNSIVENPQKVSTFLSLLVFGKSCVQTFYYKVVCGTG